MKRLIAAILLGGCLTAASYADDVAGLAPAEREFLRSEAAKMQTAGLDAKPLYNKVREGLAKGVGADALRKAVQRERELFTEAARLTAPVVTGGNPTKNEIAQSVVIAVKRGAKHSDIETAVKQNRQNPAALIATVDLLGDFARSGISGEKAVRAAADAAGRKSVSTTAPADNRSDVNRAIMRREIQQSLPALKPTERLPEPHNPTGTQGVKDQHR